MANLRQLPPLAALRAFEAAARHCSAKLAANELSVTPTAISHQVRQLEDSLGVALFIRQPRQLVLTPQGRELQAVLGEAFNAMANAVARLRAPPERMAITLSTTPAVAARWLLPRVSTLRALHPRLDLRIHASHDAVALDGVTADLAIRYGRGQWPGMVSEKLFDNVFAPACSPALKLRRPDELARHTLLHFTVPGSKSQPGTWAAWQQEAQVPGLDVSAGPVFSDETHTVWAALQGQGVALMSLALIADELRAGNLVQPFGPELPGLPFHLVCPQARRDEPAVAAVFEWVRELQPPGANS
ncbi:LysR substrate-binding domain-containing protein [Variovorax sp. 160MFSha2.1]|uniref:LysR substrate-binding domain-containing protein n=1 Tax=Variovorax sp. 160MFSha2.1 TaxID=3158367 RepID=UPI003AB0F282